MSTTWNSSSRESDIPDTILWTLQVPALTCTYSHTHIHTRGRRLQWTLPTCSHLSVSFLFCCKSGHPLSTTLFFPMWTLYVGEDTQKSNHWSLFNYTAPWCFIYSQCTAITDLLSECIIQNRNSPILSQHLVTSPFCSLMNLPVLSISSNWDYMIIVCSIWPLSSQHGIFKIHLSCSILRCFSIIKLSNIPLYIYTAFYLAL